MSADFEVIRTRSLVDEAYRQIRKQVLAGAFRPGEPLRDSTLAEQMGTSRSPVREALRLLEQSGLVQKSANRSYRIAAVDGADVPELALLRASDEILAVRRIVEKKRPLESIELVLDRLRAAGDDVPEQAAADAAFHAAVVDLAGLPRLSARFADLTDQIRLVLLAEGMEHSWEPGTLVRNHVILLDLLREAVASGDPRAVVAEWESHVHTGMRPRITD